MQRTSIVNEARKLPMTANTRNIDRLVHSGRVMVFPNEGQTPSLAGALSFTQRQLNAGTMYAAEDWSRQTIEDNLEGENLEDTIVDVMGQLQARDMEELFLYANADDTTSPAFPDADKAGDAFRENLGGTAHDGWLLLSDHLIDKQGAQPDLATDIFGELMDAIPTKLLDGFPRAEWRFFVNSSLERRYREELGERMTALGGPRPVRERACVLPGRSCGSRSRAATGDTGHGWWSGQRHHQRHRLYAGPPTQPGDWLSAGCDG